MSVFEIRANEVPAIRMATAAANGVDKNLLFVVSGGLGDRVCAEPTLRYAMRRYKQCRFSLLCDTPELFRHLEFDNIYRKPADVPVENYLALYTYPDSNLATQFFCASLMNSVDLSAAMALRSSLHPEDKVIFLDPINPRECTCRGTGVSEVRDPRTVVMHPGKTWPTRTFPSKWWKSMMSTLIGRGFDIVLIGSNTVEIPRDEEENWFDLRGKLSLNDYIWVCKNAKNLVTNDSSPLHLAASGDGNIAFVATVRSPELLYHWRHGEFGWRMKGFHNVNKM